MDHFPADTNLARTIDATLILFKSKDLVPVILAEPVQSNRKLIPKTPSPTSSHPVIGDLIQTQKTHYMAHYYLSNMAIHIPKIANPALVTIKASILSANIVCQSIVSGTATEHEQKLRIMIEQSSNNINNALKDIITAEHRALDPNAHIEYKPIPHKEAFMKILETNKEILVEMFQGVIKRSFKNVPSNSHTW